MITLDQFLRRVVKRRAPDRMRWYREFLRQSERSHRFMLNRGKIIKGEPITIGDVPVPTAQEIADIIAQDRAEGFSEGRFRALQWAFRKWEPSIRKAKGLNAARARWGKKKLG
jgi:hypothetical protein